MPAVLKPETAEEQAWEDSGRFLMKNPIIDAFVMHLIDVQDGRSDPEDGLATDRDVLERWIWYLANGEHDISWYRPVLVQADSYFRLAARSYNLEHQPAMLEPVA